MSRRKPQKPLPWEFTPHERAQERLISVQRLIRAIVRAKGVLETHKRGALRNCMYKVTEAHGKHNLRFKSRGSKGKKQAQVTHEHVLTRKELVDRVIAKPSKIKQITQAAVGCLVTKAEDRKLDKSDKRKKREGTYRSGWARYKAAKIQVIDTKTGKRVV